MKNKVTSIFFIFLILLMSSAKVISAEPFIVLQFSQHSEWSQGDGLNEFSINPDHHEIYEVQAGDSLNSIIKKFYSGSGLDKRFIQLAIVVTNPSAFSNNNPNFLFSKKKMYLPGSNEIQNLVLGKSIKKKNSEPGEFNNTRIYFFGG